MWVSQQANSCSICGPVERQYFVMKLVFCCQPYEIEVPFSLCLGTNTSTKRQKHLSYWFLLNEFKTQREFPCEKVRKRIPIYYFVKLSHIKIFGPFAHHRWYHLRLFLKITTRIHKLQKFSFSLSSLDQSYETNGDMMSHLICSKTIG